MLHCVLLAVVLQGHDDPAAHSAIKALQQQYASLNTFSATIVQHGFSGLFPADMTQELRWRKGGRFDLVVKKAAKAPKPDGLGSQAPDYYASGGKVISISNLKGRTSEAITPEPNVSPGWEVSGGPIMGWLQDTPTSRMILNPPAGTTATYAFGPTKKWQGQDVKEVVLTWSTNGTTFPISLFLTRDGKTLLGSAFLRPGMNGWLQYRNQKKNPPLPASVGQAPR